MKCGLEIHQRLRGEKLFCRSPCPEADANVSGGAASFIRKIAAVSSELGEQDAAAAFEQSRNRTMKYVANPSFVSLMETDEEPPIRINSQALEECVRICLAFGAELVDEVHVMRKSVADGSNTSGFQRTAVIAQGGVVKTSQGDVHLLAICLEEESATPAGEEGGMAVYDINRLGVPLIEIATAPEIVSGEHAKEVAEKIGLALRMSPLVMRGLGTIRQDVNISTEGGARIEIKGLQDMALLPAMLDFEVKRQQGLIAISKEQKKRPGAKAGIPQAFTDVSQIFSKTSCGIISRALLGGGVALACLLPGHGGLLGRELYAGRRYGTELSDYAKMAGGVKGLIHSDEDMDRYKISSDELDELRAALSMKEGDAFAIIADAQPQAERAIAAVLSRANFSGVPKETRRADDAGGSSFMRPLPGSARMYPETDIMPVRITPEMLGAASENPLSDFDGKKKSLVALLGAELGGQMIRSRHLALFEKLVEGGADARLAAVTLEQTLTSLRREKIAVDKITEAHLSGIFALYSKSRITKAAIPEILKWAASEPEKEAEEIAQANSLLRISGAELEGLWLREGGGAKTFMAKYRLVADGSDIAQLAKKGK